MVTASLGSHIAYKASLDLGSPVKKCQIL